MRRGLEQHQLWPLLYILPKPCPVCELLRQKKLHFTETKLIHFSNLLRFTCFLVLGRMDNGEPQLPSSSHLQPYQSSVIPPRRRLDSDPVSIAPTMGGVTGTQAQPGKTQRLPLHLPFVDLGRTPCIMENEI